MVRTDIFIILLYVASCAVGNAGGLPMGGGGKSSYCVSVVSPSGPVLAAGSNDLASIAVVPSAGSAAPWLGRLVGILDGFGVAVQKITAHDFGQRSGWEVVGDSNQ